MRIGRIDTAQLARTWRDAFADYAADMTYMTDERIRLRAEKNAVDLTVSPGAFDGQRMVGFTLVGVDTWEGCLTAFDAATGIVPEVRGRGVAGAMMEWATDRLRPRGVRRFILEVIQSNRPAIKAYSKADFQVTRKLRCFLLPLHPLATSPESAPLPIRPIDRDTVAVFAAHADWTPSWENSFAAIARLRDELVLLGAFDGEECIGEVVYSPHFNWIMSLVVIRPWRRRGVASSLVRHLAGCVPQEVETMKVLNVDATDEGMLCLLDRLGAEPYVDQYEMARAL